MPRTSYRPKPTRITKIGHTRYEKNPRQRAINKQNRGWRPSPLRPVKGTEWHDEIAWTQLRVKARDADILAAQQRSRRNKNRSENEAYVAKYPKSKKRSSRRRSKVIPNMFRLPTKRLWAIARSKSVTFKQAKYARQLATRRSK